MRTNALRAILVLGVAVAAVAGCRAKWTYDEFTMVQQNIHTREDVREIMGEPNEDFAGKQWLYERPKEDLKVLFEFDESGRVVRKQWLDFTSGLWEDTGGPEELRNSGSSEGQP